LISTNLSRCAILSGMENFAVVMIGSCGTGALPDDNFWDKAVSEALWTAKSDNHFANGSGHMWANESGTWCIGEAEEGEFDSDKNLVTATTGDSILVGHICKWTENEGTEDEHSRRMLIMPTKFKIDINPNKFELPKFNITRALFDLWANKEWELENFDPNNNPHFTNTFNENMKGHLWYTGHVWKIGTDVTGDEFNPTLLGTNYDDVEDASWGGNQLGYADKSSLIGAFEEAEEGEGVTFWFYANDREEDGALKSVNKDLKFNLCKEEENAEEEAEDDA